MFGEKLKVGETGGEVCPPERFAMVESGLYRSRAITIANFGFVRRLGLRTVLLLSPEMPLLAVTEFLKREEVQLIQLGLRVWSPESQAVSDELVKPALELALDAASHPLLVMCSCVPWAAAGVSGPADRGSTALGWCADVSAG